MSVKEGEGFDVDLAAGFGEREEAEVEERLVENVLFGG